MKHDDLIARAEAALARGLPNWGESRDLVVALLAAVREGEEARQCVEIARDFLIWQTGADVNCTLSGVEFADAAKTTLAKIDAVLAAAGLVGEE